VTKSSPLSSLVNRLPNGNIELTITLPWAQVQKAYEEVVDETVKETEIKGFRKGHAPRKLVEEKLDRQQTFSHALQHLLPKKYQVAVDEQKLKPVVYPQIKIEKGKEGEDWVFTATLCEAPVIRVGKLTKDLDQLLKNSQVLLADLLVEQEANHRLAILAENLTRLGLTVDKYLDSKKLTSSDLKAKLASEARRDLSVEFILQQIQVEQKLANRQVTLDFLTHQV